MEFGQDLHKMQYITFTNYKEMYRRGISIVKHMDMRQFLIHDKSLNYLDLAVKPRHPKDPLKFEIIRSLPPTFTEHLIAESELHENNILAKMFAKLNRYQQRRMGKCEMKQMFFARDSYRNFLSIFFRRFEVLDRNEKRTSIRALLNTRRILQIRSFTIPEYQLLIRECTITDPNPALTIELLWILCHTERSKRRIFIVTPPESLEILLCYAKALRFDFWGMWQGIGSLSTTWNPITEYIIRNRSACAFILLKYGFAYFTEERNYEVQCISLIDRRLRNRFLPTHWEYIAAVEYIRELQRPNQARMLLIITIFMVFADFAKAEDVPADCISTLVHLMRFLPDPYVVPSEMFRQLRPVVQLAVNDDLSRICRNYETAKVYGGDEYTVYQPRKLEHLCRCAVRRVLTNNFKLPEGIQELELSDLMKAYLLLVF